MIGVFINNLKRSIRRLFGRLGIEVRKKKASLKFSPELFVKNARTDVSITVLTHQNHSVFFGYHDKTPFSLNGTKILANSVEKPATVLENECSKMELGYFEKKDGAFQPNFKKISETSLWSWQQGCMLQWNPLYPDSQVYFNTLVDNKHGSVLFDVEQEKVIREFRRPIYSISPKGNIASSINFRRVAEYRPGYGYKKFSEQKIFPNVPDDDGIFLIDLETNKSELVLSIKELADYSNHEVPHYINHVRFSPDGERFLFFHIAEGVGDKRIISFYLYDINKKKLELLEASRSVSHFCWRNETEIFTSEIGGGKAHFFLYDLKTKTKKEVELPDIGDIHPMFLSADPDRLILDTKPDVNRDQHLFMFNFRENKLEHLGKYEIPKGYEDAVRCDLHPRWDRQGEFVSIDTVHNHLRSMTLVQLT